MEPLHTGKKFTTTAVADYKALGIKAHGYLFLMLQRNP